MAKRIVLPDQQVIEVPADNLTIEEARRALVAMGYGSVQTAQGAVAADGSIVFSRQVGGEKGL